jgi:hypothetical protein
MNRHTGMHVGMYDCMRSESVSGILRKPHKQTCILVCLCMYVCVRIESESASHSSPPQLKGVRVISACALAHVCVCALLWWYYFSHLHCVSLSAGAHRDTKYTHTQATLKTQANTCQVMIANQHLHSTTVSQYSATTNTNTPKR